LQEQFTAGVESVIAEYSLPWIVKRLGNRSEYWFRPTPPKNGGEAHAAVDPELDRYMHLYALNRGILMTPFHNMALISPRNHPSGCGLPHEGFPGSCGKPPRAFLDVLGQAGALFGWLSGKFVGVPIPLIGFALAGLAVIYLIYKWKFSIPAVLLAMTLVLSPEGDRFLVLVVAVLVGISFIAGMEWFRSKWIQSALIGCILISIFQMAGYGLNEVLGSIPVLHRNTFDVADYVEKNVPESSRYLFVAGQAEAEWFPYILKRRPFISKCLQTI
jgi:hypothetical protein